MARRRSSGLREVATIPRLKGSTAESRDHPLLNRHDVRTYYRRMTDLEARVAALEEAVVRLRPGRPTTGRRDPGERGPRPLAGGQPARAGTPAARSPSAAPSRVGEGEAVWQWGTEAETLREEDWTSAAGVLDALAHPVRLRLLQRVLNGTVTTADLACDDALGTTGSCTTTSAPWSPPGGCSRSGAGPGRSRPLGWCPLLVVVSAGWPDDRRRRRVPGCAEP